MTIICGTEFYLLLRKLVARFFGERGFYRLHGILNWMRGVVSPQRPQHTPLRRRDASAWSTCRVGLNVSGAIAAEGGVAEAIRLNIHSMKVAKIPFVINDVALGLSRHRGQKYDYELRGDNPFDFNLVHLNANKIQDFYRVVGRNYFENKYTIGYWAWELSHFPERWHDRFAYVDEVWTPSGFCLEAFKSVSPVPVLCIPHAVNVGLDRTYRRSEFGIHEDAYVFMFMFDFYSTFARKNPLGVVEAFKRAFSPNERAQLVLKFYNAEINPAEYRRLAQSIGKANILLLNRRGSRAETLGLLSTADAYASLHRSEGFGLTIAEAMALGKPVIATNYSGNTDYLTEDVGFPISYSLCELKETYGLYAEGNVWAEPDVEEAAHWMRYVYEHREAAQDKGRKAAASVGVKLSPLRIGAMINERLSAIIESHRFREVA